MEYLTIVGNEGTRRYIAIFRKSFNERMCAWELSIVPGTRRWLDDE